MYVRSVVKVKTKIKSELVGGKFQPGKWMGWYTDMMGNLLESGLWYVVKFSQASGLWLY
jgi:hypothetical protein